MMLTLGSVKGSEIPLSQDIEYALALLEGIGYATNEQAQIKKTKFPSATTKPTEKEARAALARVLLMDDPPIAILFFLAALFDPSGPHPLRAFRRVTFQNLSRGHSDHSRDVNIAYEVEILRRGGKTYEKAADKVASLIGISPRQVKRIYNKIAPPLKSVSSRG